MSSDSEQIHYEEAHENGFLERLLLDKRLTLANGIYFACADELDRRGVAEN